MFVFHVKSSSQMEMVKRLTALEAYIFRPRVAKSIKGCRPLHLIITVTWRHG